MCKTDVVNPVIYSFFFYDKMDDKVCYDIAYFI